MEKKKRVWSTLCLPNFKASLKGKALNSRLLKRKKKIENKKPICRKKRKYSGLVFTCQGSATKHLDSDSGPD